MTERRQRFVVEYAQCGNATQAAIRAGFSKRTAGQAGARLLKDVQICSAISDVRGPVLERAQITLESHLEELARLRDLAIAAKQLGPAVQAETSRGKVAGLYVDRIEDVTKYTDAELEAIANGQRPRLQMVS